MRKKSKNEADTHKATEMTRSLETFSESNARVGNDPVVKKSRNTGRETVQYLRKKSENELKNWKVKSKKTSVWS